MEDQNQVIETARSRDGSGSTSASALQGDPGRTPGQAEGDEAGTQEKSPREPGKTPGQAEGDPETVEDDLRQKGRQ